MGTMKLNLAGVDNLYEALPAGRYEVVISNSEIRQAGPYAKHPGADYVWWELTITSGQFKSRKVYYNTTLVPTALFGLKNLLVATGRHTRTELDSQDFDLNITDYIGVELAAVVGVKTYQGELQNTVKRVYAADDARSSTTTTVTSF